MKIIIISFFTLYALNTYAKEKAQPLTNNDRVKETEDQPLSRHRRNYTLLGSKDSKIQFSFKYQGLRKTKLFLAYTQLIAWDIWKSSSPIRDITLSPELIYRFNLDRKWAPYIDFGIFEHSSNGKADEDSRSYNTSYIKFLFQSEANDKPSLKGKIKLKWFLKLRAFYGVSDTNKDLNEYLGNWETALVLSDFLPHFFDGEQFHFRLSSGDKQLSLFDGQSGAYELGFSFRFLNSEMLPTFYVNYYNGFGETLLDYNKKSNALRFGLTQSI